MRPSRGWMIWEALAAGNRFQVRLLIYTHAFAVEKSMYRQPLSRKVRAHRSRRFSSSKYGPKWGQKLEDSDRAVCWLTNVRHSKGIVKGGKFYQVCPQSFSTDVSTVYLTCATASYFLVGNSLPERDDYKQVPPHPPHSGCCPFEA